MCNVDIKNRKYYFFNDIININNFDPNNIKIDKKSYKNIIIYYIRYVTIKDSKYANIFSTNPLYLIFGNLNGYFEEINGNEYLALVPNNESKEKVKKKYEGLCSKIKDLIRLITIKSDNYDEEYMKNKFNSDDSLLCSVTSK